MDFFKFSVAIWLVMAGFALGDVRTVRLQLQPDSTRPVQVSHVAWTPLNFQVEVPGVSYTNASLSVRNAAGELVLHTNTTSVSGTTGLLETLAGHWGLNVTTNMEPGDVVTFWADWRPDGWGSALPQIIINVRYSAGTGHEDTIYPSTYWRIDGEEQTGIVQINIVGGVYDGGILTIDTTGIMQIELGGDVSGPVTNVVVNKIKGVPVVMTPGAGDDGYALVYNHSLGRMELQQVTADLAGDLSGTLGAAVVTGIRELPVGALSPGAAQDGYGLKYDHGSGQIILGPVASQGISSNLLTLVGTATSTDVTGGQIGYYRIIRPGSLPSAVINVNGAEIAWFDLLGMTMRSGSIHLLGSELAVNVAAYDGTAANPAYTWGAQKSLGKYRFSTSAGYAEGFAVNSNLVWHWNADGIHLAAGKQLYGYTETDPLSLHLSTTYGAVEDSGGTYTTNDTVILAATLLTNGYARVEYDASGTLNVSTEISTNGTTWTAATRTGDPVYVRLTATEPAPDPAGGSITISNIVVYSWTRPELFGVAADTAGQVVLIDNAAESRQAVPLAQMEAAVAAITPAGWSEYPATSTILANGHKILLGGGWSIVEESGVGVVSFDVWGSTNGLVVANNGTPVITAQSGLAGLHIADFSLDGSNAVLWVSTNSVDANPIIQYTADLVMPDWIVLDQINSSYPTVTNDAYRIEFYMPEGNQGFIRAVKETGAARIDAHAPLYELQHRVALRPHVSTNDNPTAFTPRYPGDQLIVTTNPPVFYTASGVTTNDWWPLMLDDR